MASTQSDLVQEMEGISDYDPDLDTGDEEVDLNSDVPSNDTHRHLYFKEEKKPLKGCKGGKRKRKSAPKLDSDPPPPQVPLLEPIPPPPKPTPTQTPTPTPTPTVVSQHPKPISRPRQYQEGSQTEWVVFFRPKQKPLNFMQITKDLQKNYSGVVQCTKLNKSKLRVIVNSAVQANQIVTDLRFCIEYRVWIPAHKVEIDGVVTDEGLAIGDFSKAVGRFKNPKLPPVEVLECRQLGNVTTEGDKKKFVPSSSFRVTFAGSALPDYIELYKLRLPVRLYVPRVMSCENCQQLGHTKTYCSNKSKCSKCAGPHKDVECQKQADKCLLCGGEPHKTRKCPKYKEREDKMKRTLKERSKKSFAEILKQVNHSNRFALLGDEDSEDEDTQEVLFEKEEDSDTSAGPSSKRSKVEKAGKASGSKTKKGASWHYEEDFPPGPSGNGEPQPVPPKPMPKPAPKPKSTPKSAQKPSPIPEAFKGFLSFSTIVEWLCSLVSEPVRLLIKQFEPIARGIGKQLASTTPLLSFISFDGSIVPKLNDFQQFAFEQDCDAFALSETFLIGDETPAFKDYNIITKSRDGPHKGGGVLIGIRKCHTFTKVTLPNLGGVEAVAIQAKIRGLDICIVSVYVPPQVSLTRQKLWDMLELLQAPRLVLGDFNLHSVDWGSHKTDPQAYLIHELCDDFDMTLLNRGKQITRIATPPTSHTSGTKASAIDLSLCSNSLALICEWNVLQDPRGSDHLPIAIRVSHGPQQSTTVKMPYDLTRNIDWKQYAEAISIGIEQRDGLAPLEEYAFLASLIYDCAVQAQTKPVPGPYIQTRPPNPWWDKECSDVSAARSEAYVDFCRCGSRANFQKYRALDRRYSNMLKRKRRLYWRQFVVGLPPNTATSTLWSVGRAMRRGSVPNEGVEKSDKWILDFAKKVCPDSVPTQPNYSVVDGSEPNPPFSMMEFSIALLSCNNTAPGPDRIKFSLLKNLPEVAKQRLLTLFNIFMEQNIIPHEWRQVRVVAIQKPGKPASDHNSYRPISMLSCLRKLLEKMILDRLHGWMEREHLLSDTQYGFRRGKGTADCLALLSTEIDIARAKKQQMASVFLDIKGAFDSVSIEVLGDKLRRCGLNPTLCNFLINLLSEKHMHFAQGDLAITRISHMGLAQGSSLSPTMYNFYVSDIDACLTGDCTLKQLADDAVVSITAKKGAELQIPLQETLNNLALWAVEKGIEFSPEKTVLVVFTGKHEPAQLSLSLSGRTIKQSDSYKYLGLWFDQKGTWSKHINYLKKKCQPRINFLRSISGTTWGAHPSDMLRLYKTTILSVMEYGSFCFKSAAKSRLLVLQRIQYRCLRICLGCMHSTHNMTLEVLAGVLPLQTRYYELSYRFLIRCDYRNKLVIDNFETLIRLEFKSNRMLLYYDFMSSWEWSPSDTIDQHTPPLTSSTQISFDTSMRSDTRGIPDHLLQRVVPSIFASKYNHIPPNNRFYTDGSRSLDGSTGFGVFHESYQLFFKLKDPCSVYVAELAAIYCALRTIETMPPDHYFIFTDSLSSVEAIRSLKPTRESAYFLTEIRKILNNLAAQSFSISVVWVRAHCSIPGNEEADRLAKEGAACETIFERPISLQECYGLPRHQALLSWQEQWNNDPKGRWTFSIRPKVSRKAWFKGMDLTRGFIRTMSRLMSNHYLSKAHLYRINMNDTNLCDCGQGYQDIDHLVWACPDLQDHRTKLKDTLRARGRPPEIPIRDALSLLDLDILYPIYQFIVDSKISI